jgi:hypothetical protein
MTTTYNGLIQAMTIIHAAKSEVTREEGMMITPHWRMLLHAGEYLNRQATDLLRGE